MQHFSDNVTVDSGGMSLQAVLNGLMLAAGDSGYFPDNSYSLCRWWHSPSL